MANRLKKFATPDGFANITNSIRYRKSSSSDSFVASTQKMSCVLSFLQRLLFNGWIFVTIKNAQIAHEHIY